ncbi:MAG: protein kinase [Alphaproteobacteria bacterium]|nr:protein kinase [Alphaproteobacteria bacterium]
MVNAHPPDDALLEATLRPEVARHLKDCPRCRVHRRLLDVEAPAAEVSVAAAFDGTPMDDDGSGPRWLVWDAALGRCVVCAEPAGGGHPEPLREVASRLDALAHPHVARIHQVIDGPPLRYVRDRIAGEHLGRHDVASDPRAIAWLAQTASALAVLHEAGIAHGSLRPTSIRVTPEGRVWLVDVGLHEGSAEADWHALADLFLDIGPPVSDVLESILAGEADGTALLGWLLAMRDPGAGGGPRYEPRGILGVGGMGEVRRVYDPVLERVVAQKILSSNLLSDGAHIDRFLAEAQITAQLQHPGIVPVHDLEHLPNGAIAFTMKPIEGRTLAQVIREVHDASRGDWRPTGSGWSLRRLVEALRRVCDTIAYAHDQRVVHLDLKPGNVMLGEYGEVLVFDWGLARRLGPDGTVSLERASGTVGYMPPEQSRGSVGTAADIYALGATLREIVDGVAPVATPGEAWVPQRADAPRELVSIVLRATASAPGERYASAKDLANDLAAWQDERPVSAHAYSSVELVLRRLRPHQTPILVALGAAVVLFAIAAVSWVRVEGERDKADAMLAQSLVDKANLAWDARDPIRAEAFAAAAVGLTGRSDARGLLARLSRGWRPRLARRWAQGCSEVEAVGVPASVLCATGAEVRGWSLEGDGPGRAYPGDVARLRAGRAGWTGVVRTSVVRADGAGRPDVVVDGDEALVDAVDVGDGRVAVAKRRRLDLFGADVQGIELPHEATGLTHCGRLRFVVAMEGGNLARVDLASGELVPIGADRVSTLLGCSPDGRTLAVASDRAIQLWSLEPLQQRHLLVGHLGAVRALAWAPDGDALATGADDGTVRIWDARRGVEIGRLPGHDDMTDLAFTPDGGTLVTATRHQVRAWDLPAGTGVGTFDAVVEVVGLRWTATGMLFTLDRLGRPEGFDPHTGLETLPIYARVADLDGDPSGERVALVDRRGAFKVLDLEENVFVAEAEHVHAGGGSAVAWRPEPGAGLVASGGAAGDVRAWRLDGKSVEEAWAVGLGAPVASLRWSADGSVLAARTAGEVVVLGGDDGQRRASLPGDIVAHAVGPEGRSLALAWAKGGLALGDIAAGGQGFERIGVVGQVAGVAFSPRDPLLASVTREGLVQVFDTRDGRELARLFAHPGGATDIAFSRDGAALASSGAGGEIVLLDAGPFLEPSDQLQSDIIRRYGVEMSGTELEFR